MIGELGDGTLDPQFHDDLSASSYVGALCSPTKSALSEFWEGPPELYMVRFVPLNVNGPCIVWTNT